jgi:uncharacterized protein
MSVAQTSGLRFNVAGLLKEGAGAARDYRIDAPPNELAGSVEGARPVAPLRGELRGMRTPRSIFLRGRLQTRMVAECSRCLGEADVPIRFQVEQEFYPQVDVTTGHTLAIPDDDLGFTIDPTHELDLSELVRQHLLLELPMSAVCREACKGWCPTCGVNLNEEPCQCAPEPEDPRLAPLRALLEGAKTKS